MKMSANWEQLPFDFGDQPIFNKDDLVITQANRLAYKLIHEWPNWPQPVALLIGPMGSGKSHFSSVWREKSNAYVADMRQLDKAIECAHHGRSILLEDVDSETIDEVKLFHLFNTVAQMHIAMPPVSLLMTARTTPKMWGLHLKDLASRMNLITHITIEQPDDFLLSAVLIKLFLPALSTRAHGWRSL